jgi:hypothetical protein
MPLSRARGFHGNHEGSLTTYDHVNSDAAANQCVRCNAIRIMQSQNRRKPTDDVGRMFTALIECAGGEIFRVTTIQW